MACDIPCLCGRNSIGCEKDYCPDPFGRPPGLYQGGWGPWRSPEDSPYMQNFAQPPPPAPRSPITWSEQAERRSKLQRRLFQEDSPPTPPPPRDYGNVVVPPRRLDNYAEATPTRSAPRETVRQRRERLQGASRRLFPDDPGADAQGAPQDSGATTTYPAGGDPSSPSSQGPPSQPQSSPPPPEPYAGPPDALAMVPFTGPPQQDIIATPPPPHYGPPPPPQQPYGRPYAPGENVPPPRQIHRWPSPGPYQQDQFGPYGSPMQQPPPGMSMGMGYGGRGGGGIVVEGHCEVDCTSNPSARVAKCDVWCTGSASHRSSPSPFYRPSETRLFQAMHTGPIITELFDYGDREVEEVPPEVTALFAGIAKELTLNNCKLANEVAASKTPVRIEAMVSTGSPPGSGPQKETKTSATSTVSDAPKIDQNHQVDLPPSSTTSGNEPPATSVKSDVTSAKTDVTSAKSEVTSAKEEAAVPGVPSDGAAVTAQLVSVRRTVTASGPVWTGDIRVGDKVVQVQAGEK